MRTDIEIHGMHCVACNAYKEALTIALCPVCHAAMMAAYPEDFFDVKPLARPISKAVKRKPITVLREFIEAIDYAEAA